MRCTYLSGIRRLFQAAIFMILGHGRSFIISKNVTKSHQNVRGFGKLESTLYDMKQKVFIWVSAHSDVGVYDLSVFESSS